jgi:hypothetical protein
MNSADMLSSIGHVLYGPSGSGWLRALSEALQISERTIRRFLKNPDELSASHGLFTDCEKLLREQRDAIDRTLRALEQWRSQKQE